MLDQLLEVVDLILEVSNATLNDSLPLRLRCRVLKKSQVVICVGIADVVSQLLLVIRELLAQPA